MWRTYCSSSLDMPSWTCPFACSFYLIRPTVPDYRRSTVRSGHDCASAAAHKRLSVQENQGQERRGTTPVSTCPSRDMETCCSSRTVYSNMSPSGRKHHATAAPPHKRLASPVHYCIKKRAQATRARSKESPCCLSGASTHLLGHGRTSTVEHASPSPNNSLARSIAARSHVPNLTLLAIGGRQRAQVLSAAWQSPPRPSRERPSLRPRRPESRAPARGGQHA